MKLLITDMDGTLVDSMEFLRELAIALVAAEGHSEAKMRTLYDKTFGKPISLQFHEWNQQYPNNRVNVPKLVHLYEAVHQLAAPNFPTTDFCRSLATFRHDVYPDWRFALVTSTHAKIVHHMPQIRHVQWDYVGGYDGIDKNKRVQILDACVTAGVSTTEAVYIGDAPSDKTLADHLGIPYYYPNGTLVPELLGQPMFTGV
jgi:phosphoglycolate phosphatase-like HAD superfamily hydrolase